MAEFIDFTRNIGDIITQLNVSNRNMPITNENLFDYFKFLNGFRHDFFHYLVLKMFNRVWTEERPVIEFIPNILEDYGRKTPDLMLNINDCWYIIDVSISVDVSKTKKQKEDKYLPIVEWMNRNGYVADYIHVNVKSDFSNMENELDKLSIIKHDEFDYASYGRIINIIKDKKEFVNEKIDKEYFDTRKKQEYINHDKNKSDNNNQNKNEKEEFYLEGLKKENMGVYTDIEIDLDLFRKFNSGFDIINVIEKTQEIHTCDIDSLAKMFKDVLENDTDPLNRKYRDEKLTGTQFDDAKDKITNKNSKMKKRRPKPTHHMMIPFSDEIDPKKIAELEKVHEPEMINKFIVEFLKDSELFKRNESPQLEFLQQLFICHDKTISDKSAQRSSFNIFYNNNTHQELKNEYSIVKKELEIIDKKDKKQKYNKKNIYSLGMENIIGDDQLMDDYVNKLKQKHTGKSLQKYDYNTFLKEKTGDDLTDRSHYTKEGMHKVNFNDLSPIAIEYYKKAGIGAELKKPEVVDKLSINEEERNHIDHFLQLLSTNVKYNYVYREEDFLNNPNNIGNDAKEIMELKINSIENYKQYFDIIKQTHAYNYSRNLHYFYKQLMHITQMNSKKGTFKYYNCGLENCLVIVAQTYNNTVHDYGKPFLCVVKTKNPGDYNEVFGKTHKYIASDGYWYVVTNWRRLTLTKITFLCDVFYSTLASTMNSVCSTSTPYSYLTERKLEKVYSFRTLIGYSTNQRISEILMDTRYAYMSAFSVYTNINKLLEEKFGPPYFTCLEVWIVNRLFTRLSLIHDKALKDGITQFKIEMDYNVRNVETIGGTICLPSLWLDNTLVDVNELLDEAFIYVHTMKEPSNIFHENIKALKTITQFQKEYDELTIKHQKGAFENTEEIYSYLMHPTKIGCCSAVIVDSTIHTLTMEKPFFRKIINNINGENIGDVLSTKAVIADNEREILENDHPTQRDLLKKTRRLKYINNKSNQEDLDKIKFFLLQSKTKYYNKLKSRQKVMETVLDRLEQDPKLSKTVHFANDFIKREKGRVTADICIKAQYGAKREFYVVNIGAKTLARLTETFFKELCQNSPNEAISIPGDEKILKMQAMLDRIYHNKTTPNHKLMYVNGDCTKWSAAETMTSFLSMCYALKKQSGMTECMYQLLVATFNAWSDKRIQIPMDILNKVVPNRKYKTDYLNDLDITKTGQLKSTQNFLQGMFNYSSSYKAVCCNNYTYKLWKKIYPESKLLVEHMEHSDDYVLVVLYETIAEFEKYRTLQKMVMRLHGYNDSDRKTSCQPFFMEFVSQISFNGVMLYPQIKKAKEVNLSLPCTGYVQDMESALSRVGECSRVGCNQSFLYFFQRLHVYCVAEAYSIIPNGTNNYGRKWVELLNQPIELFGIPDCLPVFSLYCRGNVNNYRIYNYTDNKKLIQYLYTKGLGSNEEEDYLSENIEYKFSIKTPKFMYEIFNRTTKKLRKAININPEEIKEFWEQNISYKLIKPKNVGFLIKWIKCMFYNKTFLEAYCATARPMMTMRISRFINNKIIKDTINISDYMEGTAKLLTKAYTMQEYYQKTMKEYEEFNVKGSFTRVMEVDLLKVITKCDPTYSAIYAILGRVKIIKPMGMKTRTIQIATKTPMKLKTINIVNQPAVLLQYIYNKENFVRDDRKVMSKESLDEDIKEIQRRIDPKILNSKSTMALLSVYNDLMINKEKRIVMFGYSRHVNTLIESIIETIKFNYLPGYILWVDFTNVITIKDPVTDTILFSRGARLSIDYYRQCCENTCLLFVYLYKCLNYTIDAIRKLVRQIKYTVNLKEEESPKKYNIIEILNKLTPDYIKQYNYNLEDRKIIGVLKIIFLDDYDIADDLVNSIYSFSYKYITKDTPINNQYLGETILTFTYFNTTCKVYYNQNQFPEPLVIMNKYFDSTSTIMYNIAIKMTKGMSDSEFERTINTDRIKPIKYKDIKNKDFLKNHNIVAVIKNYKEYKKVIKLKDLKDDDEIIPFLITKNTLVRGGDIQMKTGIARAYFDTDNLCMRLGKSKLYTLPFWKCKQYFNCDTPRDLYVDDLLLKDLMGTNVIEKHLKMELSKYSFNQQIQSKPKVDLENYVFDVLKKYKLYNYNFTQLIKTNNNNLNEIITPSNMNLRSHLQKITPVTTFETSLKLLEKEVERNKGVEDILKRKTETTNQAQKTIETEKNKVKENKREILIGENENMTDTLDQLDLGIVDLLMDDDFLIDEDNVLYDLPDMDNEDFNEDILKQQYLGKELLSYMQGELKVADMFIIEPTKIRKETKNNNITFMIERITTQLPLYIVLNLYSKEVDTGYQYMSNINYLLEMKNVLSLYENKNLLNKEQLELILIMLLKFFCFTYIKDDYSRVKLGLQQNQTIILYKHIPIQYLDEETIFEQEQEGRLLKHTPTGIDVKIDFEVAKRNYTEDLLEGKTSIQITNLNPFLNGLVLDMKKTISSNVKKLMPRKMSINDF